MKQFHDGWDRTPKRRRQLRVSAGSVAAEPEGESKMNSRYVKLPDWQMGLTWLAVTALATVIYFVPMARLVEAVTN